MYKNILVPIAVDHAPTSDAALKVARALAADGAKITALSVVEMPPPIVAAELPEGLLDKTKASALEALESYVGEGIESEVVVGHAARTINDYAEDHGVDCIVIASHQPGLADYFLGSTANHVVRHAHCAVHVVR